MENPNNCHGCKWLSEYKRHGNGSGYCSMVERSKANQELQAYIWQHREEYQYGRKEKPSLKVRRPDMERCELYSPGEFTQRYKEG